MSLNEKVQKAIEDFEDFNKHNAPVLTIGIKPNREVHIKDSWIDILEKRDCAADPKIVEMLKNEYIAYKNDKGEGVPENFSITQLNNKQLAKLYGQTNLFDNSFLYTQEIKFPHTVFIQSYNK